MLFGHHLIDKTLDEHVRYIADFASDPQTLIFLDTNIIAYVFKLHEAARREFFVWSDSIAAEGRLIVPAWAATEYLSRVTSKSLESLTPKSKEPSQATKLLDALHESALRFVDDVLLAKVGFAGDRTAYISGFRGAIDDLNKYMGVFSQQFDVGVIHQQIVVHLSASILDSDLVSLCARAMQEGPARFGHRIPPGFLDDHKDENPFGDLIIWYEILEKTACEVDNFSKVLFLSNDEKSDWVYAPKMRTQIVRGNRKSIGNSSPEIRLADPRLVSEFRRKTGNDNIEICNLAVLVEGLSKTSAAKFKQLAAAIQIDIQESVSEESDTATTAGELLSTPDFAAPSKDSLQPDGAPAEAPAESTPARVIEHPTTLLHYDQEALQDGQYQADAPSEINEIIRALKSLNWYTQNPAVSKIQTIRQEEFTPSSWFVLGRNVYQAACGNSQKAMEFMSALEKHLSHFPPMTAQHFLAGMLFEIYFDSRGEFRSEAKFGYAEKPLSLVVQGANAEALAFITSMLEPHRKRLVFMPGDQTSKTVHIVSGPMPQAKETETSRPKNELRSVTLDGIELMRDVPAQEESSPWSMLVGRPKLSPERIREKISDYLSVPKWALICETEPPIRLDEDLAVPSGRELDPKQALRPD